MTDRDRWDLRGPVRACRLQRTWYTRRCGTDECEFEKGGDIADVEFRADGSLTRHWHHNPDGSEWTSTYEYNDADRLTALRMENEGAVVCLRLYDYDPAGRLVRVVDRPRDGGERIAESYEYGDAGIEKKTVYADLAAQRPNTLHGWAVEGTDGIFSATGATTMTTLYNGRGRPAELRFYDGSGLALSRVEFVYDHDGNLVEEAQSNSVETLPSEVRTSLSPAHLETLKSLFGMAGEPIRRKHVYDGHGRRIATGSRMSRFGGDSKTMAYNEHGDPIEDVSEREQREYDFDEEGRLSDIPAKESVSRTEARFKYDYDAHGNWVTKAVECRSGMDRDYTLTSVERRTLGYFE